MPRQLRITRLSTRPRAAGTTRSMSEIGAGGGALGAVVDLQRESEAKAGKPPQ